jgi:hypothetical protein
VYVKHTGLALSILSDVTELDIIVDCDDTIEEGHEYKLLLWPYKQHTVSSSALWSSYSVLEPPAMRAIVSTVLKTFTSFRDSREEY